MGMHDTCEACGAKGADCLVGSPFRRVCETCLCEHVITERDDLRARLAAAEAERDEAREALRPFATMAAQFDKPARLSARDDEDQIYTVDFVPGVDPATIRVGDLRAARRALGGRS